MLWAERSPPYGGYLSSAGIERNISSGISRSKCKKGHHIHSDPGPGSILAELQNSQIYGHIPEGDHKSLLHTFTYSVVSTKIIIITKIYFFRDRYSTHFHGGMFRIPSETFRYFADDYTTWMKNHPAEIPEWITRALQTWTTGHPLPGGWGLYHGQVPCFSGCHLEPWGGDLQRVFVTKIEKKKYTVVESG